MLWWQFCTTTVLALCDTGRTKSSAGPRDAANSCVAACQFCEENLGRSVAPLPTDRPRLRPTGRPRPNYSISKKGSNAKRDYLGQQQISYRESACEACEAARVDDARVEEATAAAARAGGGNDGGQTAWVAAREAARPEGGGGRDGGGGDGDGGRGGGEGGGSYAISVNSCGKGVDQKSERRHSRKDLKKRASHTHSSSTRWHQPLTCGILASNGRLSGISAIKFSR